MHERATRLDPALGVLDLRSPRKLSKNIIIPPPVIATISGWVHGGSTS